ncbi:MAG: SAM-dependent methyltransferase [Kineosporiaceae bacterium]|nr:SAM-dependent methyltransferase [Kineosporiaceae bacterium]MBK8075977.1 SAM-dependent methyltransferase [Kineosporiaceae bacterium]
MDLAGISGLLTEQGWALLESLPPYREDDALGLGEQLRAAGHDPALVAAALTQSRLRSAARAKFGPFADGMLFTVTGLEQATRFSVAARHAQRFVSAGIDRVADLGCGIGADSMALATFDREVLAVERDEVTAAVATMNLRHWPEASVRCADATTVDLAGFGGAFVDPARRNETGKRLLDPRLGSPPLSFVLDLAQRLPAVGLKTAPGIPHHLVPAGAEAQWISVGGDVVEAGLWFGLTARDGVRRSALVLPAEGDESPPAEVSDAGMPAATVGPVAAYLYEPDGAVIRAGLVGQVAAAVGGHLVDPTIAYVTGEALVRTPLARAYAVQDVFGFQLKTLRSWLRDRGVGRLTIKKRGTAVQPEQLRKQLRLSTSWGEADATIVLTRVAGRQSVIAVRPVL